MAVSWRGNRADRVKVESVAEALELSSCSPDDTPVRQVAMQLSRQGPPTERGGGRNLSSKFLAAPARPRCLRYELRGRWSGSPQASRRSSVKCADGCTFPCGGAQVLLPHARRGRASLHHHDGSCLAGGKRAPPAAGSSGYPCGINRSRRGNPPAWSASCRSGGNTGGRHTSSGIIKGPSCSPAAPSPTPPSRRCCPRRLSLPGRRRRWSTRPIAARSRRPASARYSGRSRPPRGPQATHRR